MYKACVCAAQFNKIYFYVEMKITGTTTNGLDLDKYYSEHDPEQHSRGFSRHFG